MTLDALAQRAYRIRRSRCAWAKCRARATSARPWTWADVLAVAYRHAMKLRPDDPHWEGRDRFLLSHGHYAIALYAALIEAGVIPESELETYGSDDSRLPMSGMASYTPGMEISGGSLGQGLSIAVGHGAGPQAQEEPRPCLQRCPTASSTRARPGEPP
jgi:transketolase